MKNIMFVCNGNICRSVIAEYLFRDMLEKEGLARGYRLCSSGVFAYTGQSAIEKTVRNTKEQTGLDVSNHKAINTADSEILHMDLILCMENAQKLQLQAKYKEVADRVYTLKEYVIYDNADNKDVDIADPFNGDDEVFVECINQIRNSLNKLIKILE